MYEWDFIPVLTETGFLLAGFRNTLILTATSLSGGLVVGLILAMARLSPRLWLKLPADTIIEIFRITPPLVQLFWFFFGLPLILSIEMTPFLAAALTFTIQSGAFFAEIVRAGIVSIERGQWEAAKAIGMTYNQCMRRVVLPQAVKRMFPSMMERSIELMKTTTLVATVSYADLLFHANELAQKTFRPLEVFTVVALIYFITITMISFLAARFERRLARSGEFTT